MHNGQAIHKDQSAKSAKLDFQHRQEAGRKNRLPDGEWLGLVAGVFYGIARGAGCVDDPRR